LAESQDEYFALAIVGQPDANGENMMTSVWEPTLAELKQLNEGGAVRLTILGSVHPPVMMATQPAPE
jgi:hypothetical protein